MRGIVLAAGEGRRLRPLTERLPKALLPVAGTRSILELALANLKAVGVDDVTIVVGHAAAAIEQLAPAFERRYELDLLLVDNDKASVWNNAYSLWLARASYEEGALLVNGDTVHPPIVERRLLDGAGEDLRLAIDSMKSLGEEEMKVHLDDGGRVTRINKKLDPCTAAGEYIGVAYIPSAAAPALSESLRRTWERDTTLYYEDGFQDMVDHGGRIETAGIAQVEWVEVDDHDDLAKAKQVACRY
jgi:choline kinase